MPGAHSQLSHNHEPANKCTTQVGGQVTSLTRRQNSRCVCCLIELRKKVSGPPNSPLIPLKKKKLPRVTTICFNKA